MINHVTKSDLVFEELRDMIFSGELKPGERISAIEIASRMGVSRTPVNEAVKRLSDRKLVSILPNVGFEIIALSWKDILDLQYLKMSIEKTAVEWMRERKIQIDIKLLKDLNEKILKAVDTGDRKKYNESVRSYHLEFISSVGSKPLLDTFAGVWEYSGWEDTGFQALSSELADQCREHFMQLEHLERGEYDTVLELTRNHGEKWIEIFRRTCESSEAESEKSGS